MQMLKPWIQAKSVPDSEILYFEAHEKGQEQKRVRGREKEDAFVKIIKGDKLRVHVSKGESEIQLGPFDNLSGVEAVIADGMLFVLVYKVAHSGKITSTQAFRFTVGTSSLTAQGTAKGTGRLDFRSTTF